MRSLAGPRVGATAPGAVGALRPGAGAWRSIRRTRSAVSRWLPSVGGTVPSISTAPTRSTTTSQMRASAAATGGPYVTPWRQRATTVPRVPVPPGSVSTPAYERTVRPSSVATARAGSSKRPERRSVSIVTTAPGLPSSPGRSSPRTRTSPSAIIERRRKRPLGGASRPASSSLRAGSGFAAGFASSRGTMSSTTRCAESVLPSAASTRTSSESTASNVSRSGATPWRTSTTEPRVRSRRGRNGPVPRSSAGMRPRSSVSCSARKRTLRTSSTRPDALSRRRPVPLAVKPGPAATISAPPSTVPAPWSITRSDVCRWTSSGTTWMRTSFVSFSTKRGGSALRPSAIAVTRTLAEPSAASISYNTRSRRVAGSFSRPSTSRRVSVVGSR